MTNRFRVEAWSLPLATTTKTVHSVPFITGSFRDEVGVPGRGSIAVRGDWDRLSEVVDPSNGVGSKFMVFQDNALIGSFFGHRTKRVLTDLTNSIVTIDGAGQGSVTDFARLENFDYPARPTADPDWNFGSGTAVGLRNGSFEDSSDVDGALLHDFGTDFEDQSLQGWVGIRGGGYFRSNDIGPSVDSGDAEAGTYSLSWNPGLRHSGMQKKVILQGGATYTWTLKLKSATSGRRFTMGIKLLKGMSHTSTNGYVHNGIGFVELDNVARNSAGNGLPGGSTDGTWQTFVMSVTTPTFNATEEEDDIATTKIYAMYDHHDGASGPAARIDSMTVTGPGLGLLPWVPTFNADVSTFAQDDTFADDETFSAHVVTTAADRGIKQFVEGRYIVGRTYTFYAKVHHDEGGARNFRLLVQRGETGGGTLANSGLVSIPTGGGFTQLSVTFLADQEDLRFVIQKETAGEAWYDTTRVVEGLPPASWGDILQQFYDDAAVDHIGEAGRFVRDTVGFLDYTSFTTTLDSSSNAWSPALVEYRGRRGKRYRQIMADGQIMGFEWEVVDDVATGMALNVYNAYDWSTRTGGIGTNRVGTDVPVIRFGAGVTAGPLVDQAMTANRMHVEGDEFRWDVRRDATAIGDYDTREMYEGDVNLLDDATLGEVGDQFLDETTIPTTSIQVNIKPVEDPDVATPYAHFVVGDTYQLDLIGQFSGNKRVVSITTTFTPGVGEYTVDFDKTSYTSDPMKAVVVAVQKLLDQFDELEGPESDAGGPGQKDHEHPKESVPTILVASFEARDEVRNMADFLCDGTDDHLEIQEAIDLVENLDVAAGRVLLSEGDFTLVSTPSLTLSVSLHLQGMGVNQTALICTGASGIAAIAGGVNVQLSDFTISNTVGHGISLVSGFGSFIENVSVGAAQDAIRIAGNRTIVRSCLIGGAGDGIRVLSGNHVLLQGNHFLNTGDGINIEGSATNIIVTGNLIDSAEHGIVLNGCTDVLVHDNIIHEPGDETDNTFDAILLTGNTDRNSIAGNKIIPKTSANQPRYGINISASTCDDNRIGDNDFGVVTDYGTHPLNDAGTGTKYPTARTADMSVTGTLSTGTGLARYPIAEASIMIDAHATVGGAPSGGPVTVDLDKNGTTMYATATNPSIADGTNVGNKAPADQTLFATNDYITLNLDAVNGATDLTCVVRFLVA